MNHKAKTEYPIGLGAPGKGLNLARCGFKVRCSASELRGHLGGQDRIRTDTAGAKTRCSSD